ncbi:MAG: response regulator [Gammaproteobacteria bacterium]|nr:response regulator [Gammaproteobacteria bacterium]
MPETESSEGKAESTAAGDATRVLVVEDDLHIGRLVERILAREGYVVVRVMDVDSAWAVLEEPEVVDLLFTDVVLPGSSSGADLAAQLRKRCPELPIILTTGYDQSRIADHPGLLDTVAFLPKPFTAVQVRDLVRQELGRT